MFNFVRVLLAGLVLFSGSVFADNFFYWSIDKYSSKHGSASSACSAIKGTSYGSDYYYQNNNTVVLSETSARCEGDAIRHDDPSRKYEQTWTVSRRQDSCPAGEQFDFNLQQCKLPPEPESFEFLFCYNYDGGDGCAPGTNKGRPDSFCKNGVVFSADYNPSTTDASCYSYGNGDGTSGPAIMCSVTGTPTDQSCKTDYKTDTPDNSCPAGTVSGEFNNKRVCVPSSTGGGSGDGGEDGDNSGDGDGDGDGSGGETGGDGDGNGSDGGGDGTGSGGGSGGGNNGGGGSNGGDGNGTDGDGSGSGSGNGSGDGEGEGEEEGIGTGQGVEFCESGRCEFGDEKSDFFGGEVRTFSESMSAIFEGMQNSPLNSAISNIKFPEGGTCPTGSMSIDIGIGVIPLTFEEHCNFWEQISPVLSAAFLALWSVIAVRVFLSA